MAQQLAFNNWLRDDIGFADDARVTHVRGLGLDTWSDLAEYEDEDVKILCNGARKETPAFPINAIIEKRLKLACYGAQIYEDIARPIDRGALTINRLKQLDKHRTLLKNHNDPEGDIPKVTKTYSIDKTLDALPTVLRSRIGCRGVALSYVIRAEVTVPAITDLIANRPYGDGYDSLMEELIARVPHNGIGWEDDNAAVYEILFEMVKDSPMATSLKRHQGSRNGRGAYLSLVQHNLGEAQWDRVIKKAEDIQTQRIWNGRNHRFSLKNHCNQHRDSFNDMVRASEHIQYEIPNEHTRVSRLLNSIQADHIASVTSAKTTIEADNARRNDFELAADFLCLLAPKSKPMQRDHRVSSLTTEESSQLKSLDDVEVEDVFYKSNEYNRLSQEAKTKLFLLRKQRGDDSSKGHNGKGKGNRKRGRGNSNESGKNSSRNAIKKLKQRIAALETEKGTNNEKESEESNSSSKKGGKGGKKGGKKVKFNQRPSSDDDDDDE